MPDFNFKDGIIREGNSIGNGTRVGNVKDGFIYSGDPHNNGNGTRVGNVKDGIVYEGDTHNNGNGTRIGIIKDGIVYEGFPLSSGTGKRFGEVKNFTIKGIEKEKDETIVAVYHFLVKKIF